jgi:Domain of unknown function (DUF4157)
MRSSVHRQRENAHSSIARSGTPASASRNRGLRHVIQRSAGNQSVQRAVHMHDGETASSKNRIRSDPFAVHRVAASGLRETGGTLPYRNAIQAPFGRHDISGVTAHVDAAASRSAANLGAGAYTLGEHIAFRRSPDLRRTAHEAAHVIQQRSGVATAVGRTDDRYERHANAVADAVVRGRSAESLLDRRFGQSRMPTMAIRVEQRSSHARRWMSIRL